MSAIDELCSLVTDGFETYCFTSPETAKRDLQHDQSLFLKRTCPLLSNFPVSFLETLELVEALARAWGCG
jgi:hypothetical protein